MSEKLDKALAEWQKKQQLLQAQNVKAANKKQPAKRKSAAATAKPAAKSRTSKGGTNGSVPVSGPASGQSTKSFLRTTAVPKAAAAIPIGKQLKDVVDHLEKIRQPLSAEQITEAVEHDITGNAELFQQLQGNAKIRVLPDGQYEYKPEHELQDKGEVLALLLRHPQGLPLGQIRDAYKGVEEDVKAMVQDGKLWSIHNAEKKDDVLFPKDTKPLISVSQELVDFWHSIKVPEDPARVIEQLQQAKLPAAPRKVARKRIAPPGKDSKRKRRAVNMATATNVHMPELFAGSMPDQID